MFTFVFMLQELIFPDYRLLTFCNWLLSQIAFSGGGARGVAGVNICQLPHLIPTLPPATCHLPRDQTKHAVFTEQRELLLVFIFVYSQKYTLDDQLIAYFGICLIFTWRPNPTYLEYDLF